MAFTFGFTDTWESGSTQDPAFFEVSADAALLFPGVLVVDADDADLTGSLDVSEIEALYVLSSVNMTLRTNATNELQTVTITGSPTGGTFTLTYSGQTTAGIAYNASAAALKAALEALSNIGAGDVEVLGGPGPATPWTVEFRKALAAQNVAQMTGSAAGLTGGAPVLSITTTIGGVAAAQTILLVAGHPLKWIADDAYYANPLSTDVTKLLASNDSGAAGTFSFYALYNP